MSVKYINPASPLSPFSPNSPISPAEQNIHKSAFDYGDLPYENCVPAEAPTVTTIATTTMSNSSNEPTTINSKTTSNSEKKSNYSSSEKSKKKRSRRSSFQLKDTIEYDLKENELGKVEKEEQLLKSRGYEKIEEMAVTLQGSIGKYYKKNGKSKELVVIKTTNKELHKKGIVKRDGIILNVKEDIIKEKNLNIILSKKKGPPELVRYIDFFESESKYFLASEYGGEDLFQWVVVNHQRINEGKLSLKKWRDHVRICFSQMCRLVEWLHVQNRVCHLDISLENSLIESANYDPKTQTINKDECQVKFCDLGVAEMFMTDSFECSKFVGKKGYKSPEVVVRCKFDARKADIWSLGVVLFCMLIGAPPFKVAHCSDDNFSAVISGKLKYLISEYGRLKYMSKFAFDLLTKIFVYENERITIEEILLHPYVKDVLLAKEQRQMVSAHQKIIKNLSNSNQNIAPKKQFKLKSK